MLKKTNLFELAYNELVRRIVSGEFSEGESLQEEKLTAEFGISRTPVREALRKLAAEGLIEHLTRGFRVTLLDKEARKELFECRAALEVQALERALPAIPEKETTRLLKKLKGCGARRNPRSAALEADVEMHGLIREYCGNRYLAQLLEQLERKSAPYRTYRNYGENSFAALSEERIRILESILARDASRSADLLRVHIMKGCEEKK